MPSRLIFIFHNYVHSRYNELLVLNIVLSVLPPVTLYVQLCNCIGAIRRNSCNVLLKFIFIYYECYCLVLVF